jgi:thiamine-phosphate pyrophosphorylase
MQPLSNCRLYTFVDTAYLHGRDPRDVAQALCDGGADLIQVRAKTSPPDHIRELVERIQPMTRRAGVWLVVNDYPTVALQAGADAVHLGQEDFFDKGFTAAAQVTGCPKHIALGLSTHAPEQARRTLRIQPDYIAVGPVFSTVTKPGAVPVTLEYVRWAAENVRIPWFAIGGINLENLDAVLEAGARRVCVVSAILKATDPARACDTFKQRLISAAS